MAAGRFALPLAVAGVALGVLLGDLLSLPLLPPVAGGSGAAVLLLALAVGGRRAGGSLLLIGVALITIGLGYWRQSSVGASVAAAGETGAAALVGRGAAVVHGTVVDDPRPRGDRLQFVIDDVLAEVGGSAIAIPDRLLIWLPRGLDLTAGERIRVTTSVELPEDFDGFAYREYLARQGIGGIGRAESAEVTGASGGPGSPM